jgi:hypothetical protein
MRGEIIVVCETYKMAVSIYFLSEDEITDPSTVVVLHVAV